VERFLRWAYQANVMKTFEQARRATERTRGVIAGQDAAGGDERRLGAS
jgi:hypothetical protein